MEDAEAVALGLSPVQVARLRSPPPDGQEGVWRQNLAAVRAFLAVSSQWRVASGGMGGLAIIGLDYTAVRAGLGALRIRVTPDLWTDLQIMEAAAVAEMAARRG